MVASIIDLGEPVNEKATAQHGGVVRRWITLSLCCRKDLLVQPLQGGVEILLPSLDVVLLIDARRCSPQEVRTETDAEDAANNPSVESGLAADHNALIASSIHPALIDAARPATAHGFMEWRSSAFGDSLQPGRISRGDAAGPREMANESGASGSGGCGVA